jgi:hypothetical protein
VGVGDARQALVQAADTDFLRRDAGRPVEAIVGNVAAEIGKYTGDAGTE